MLHTDNSVFKNYPIPLNDWTPSNTFSLSGTTLSIEDGSTFFSGDSLVEGKVTVLDANGGQASGTILLTGHANLITIDLSSLDASGGYYVQVTTLCTTGRAATGIIAGVGIATTSGVLGGYTFYIRNV